MRRIYFGHSCIVICKPSDEALSDPNTVEFFPGDDGDVSLPVDMLKAGTAPERIFLTSPAPGDVYRRICSQFKEVNAAGGLVSNRRGDCLLIRRSGLWDLPKGHQEPGEAIEVTAMREVAEETGLSAIKLGRHICTTDHCYLRDGLWHLKHTWWYAMLYTDPVDLTPQIEEDITKAAWVPRSALATALTETYPSIQEVFRMEGYSRD